MFAWKTAVETEVVVVVMVVLVHVISIMQKRF